MSNILPLLEFFIVLIAFASIVALLENIPNWIEYKRYKKLGMLEIDKLNGVEFEKYLEILFVTLGYKVKRTPARGDYGADLIISKGGISAVVQAKRYKGNVGIKSIQEVVAAKAKYRCKSALVVTNSYFTPAAKKLASVNKVELWDRKVLASKIELSQNSQKRGER